MQRDPSLVYIEQYGMIIIKGLFIRGDHVKNDCFRVSNSNNTFLDGHQISKG
jgi:hypothetical protein